MKIRMNFGRVKTIVIVAVIAAAVALAIMDILMLTGAAISKTTNPAVAGSSLAAAVIIAVGALLILLGSRYKFAENALLVRLGFFNDKIEWDKIQAVRENLTTHELYLYFEGEEKEGEKKDEYDSLKLFIAVNKNNSFIAALREKCPALLVDTFTPPAKDKNKK